MQRIVGPVLVLNVLLGHDPDLSAKNTYTVRASQGSQTTALWSRSVQIIYSLNNPDYSQATMAVKRFPRVVVVVLCASLVVNCESAPFTARKASGAHQRYSAIKLPWLCIQALGLAATQLGVSLSSTETTQLRVGIRGSCRSGRCRTSKPAVLISGALKSGGSGRDFNILH